MTVVLPDGPRPSVFVEVAIAIQAADVGFIDLNLAHKLWEVLILHRRANALEHVPSRTIVAASDLPMDLQSAHSLLALAHQIDDFKPSGQRIVGILENRLSDNAKAIAVAPAAVLVLADPMEGPRLERVNLIAVAARASDAVGPTHIAEQRLAGFLAREVPLQLGERDVRLSGERLTDCNFVVHEEKYSLYRNECQA